MSIINISGRKLKGIPCLSKESSRKIEDLKDFSRLGKILFQEVTQDELDDEKSLIKTSDEYFIDTATHRVYSQFNEDKVLEIRGYEKKVY